MSTTMNDNPNDISKTVDTTVHPRNDRMLTVEQLKAQIGEGGVR
ncbi:hypothetical protein [Arthrobacter sp. NPDC058127]